MNGGGIEVEWVVLAEKLVETDIRNMSFQRKHPADIVGGGRTGG